LLLLLGQQKYLEMETREGKEALQNSVLGEVQRIITAETGKPGVEAVFFTTFVMQ
jgi:flagellar protein FliL